MVSGACLSVCARVCGALVTRLLLSVVSLNFLCESLSSFLRSDKASDGEKGHDIHWRGKKMALKMFGSNEMVMTLREDVSFNCAAPKCESKKWEEKP